MSQDQSMNYPMHRPKGGGFKRRTISISTRTDELLGNIASAKGITFSYLCEKVLRRWAENMIKKGKSDV